MSERQALPTPGRINVTPIARATWARLLDEAEQRGIATYGTTLQTHNGRDVFRDLLEELVDAFQYAVQAGMETNDLRAALAAAEARADAADKRAEYYQDFQGRLAEWRGVEVAELCKKCGGLGQAGYSDTSTWHGGMGGQAMTSDVCDKCWGSGIAKRPGADLRAMGARIKAAEARAERLAAIVRAMVRDIRASEMEEGRPEQECVSLDSICSLFGCPIEPGDLEDEA